MRKKLRVKFIPGRISQHFNKKNSLAYILADRFLPTSGENLLWFMKLAPPDLQDNTSVTTKLCSRSKKACFWNRTHATCAVFTTSQPPDPIGPRLPDALNDDATRETQSI